MTRSYVYVFHQNSFVNKKIYFATCISSGDGNVTSPFDQNGQKLNSLRGSYVVNPALSDHYGVGLILNQA